MKVTKSMLIPATIATIDRLVELGHYGSPLGYKDLFYTMFPTGRYGTVHNRLMGVAFKVWEAEHKKAIDVVLPTLRTRHRFGQWHSVFTTEEQWMWIEKARHIATANRKRLAKKYGTDRVWTRAYLELTASDIAFAEGLEPTPVVQ